MEDLSMLSEKELHARVQEERQAYYINESQGRTNGHDERRHIFRLNAIYRAINKLEQKEARKKK